MSASRPDCERIVAATVERFGAADILVNNAAHFALVPLIDADAAATRDFSQRQCRRTAAVRTRLHAQALAQGRSGEIVNVSSIAGARPAPGCGLYSASKAALDRLTRSMALEWGPQGVRVNAVAPGHVATEGVLEDFQAGRLDEAGDARLDPRPPHCRRRRHRRRRPVPLLGCARHVMGQVLTVDGGEGF